VIPVTMNGCLEVRLVRVGSGPAIIEDKSSHGRNIQSQLIPQNESLLQPGDVIPVIAMRNVALLPGIVVPITLGRRRVSMRHRRLCAAGRKIRFAVADDSAGRETNVTRSSSGRCAGDRRSLCNRAGWTHHLVAQG